MVEREHRTARGRHLRPLAALALLPGALAGQVGQCEPAATIHVPPTHWSAPSIALARGREVVILGKPAYLGRRGEDGALVAVDSVIGGLVLTDGAAVRTLPLPEGARAFEHPRAVARPDGSLDVLWGEKTGRSENGSDLTDLRVARLVGDRWVSSRAIAHFETLEGMTRSMASDIVEVNGINYFAFSWNTVDGSNDLLAVASDSGGRWRVRLHRLPVLRVHAVELGEDDGALAVLLTMTPHVLPPGSYVPNLVMSRLGAAGWSEPAHIAGDSATFIHEPRLVRSSRGLVAAWSEMGRGSRLNWREVRRGVPVGPAHVLEDSWNTVQGLAPHRDLIAAVDRQGAGMIVRVFPDGHEVITRIPNVNSMPATITSVGDRVLAFVMQAGPAPEYTEWHLAGVDITCLLRPRASPVRR